MILKIVLIAALIFITYTLLKRQSKRNHTLPSQPQSPSAQDVSTKRCAQCGVHLPEEEALAYQTLYFCCNEHKKNYLEDHSTEE